MLVRFENVWKVYRAGWRVGVQALRGVSFTIPQGSTFALLGPNRAGKTTLVKLLLSIARPTSGRIERLGRPSSDRSTLAQVGYLHESQAFPRYLTAQGLLEFYGALTGVSAARLRKTIPELLARVGLADRSGDKIATYSKGMVQRLALAQALLNDPELLVLDEPTEGLDLVARQLLHNVIRERKQQGKTAILVSHSLADVEQLCDRVAVLRHGELAFVGSLAKLRHEDAAEGPCPLEDALQPIYEEATP